MAKNTTGKKKIIVASILAGLAMSTMGPNVMAVSSIPFTDKPSSALGNGSVKPGTTNGVAIGNAAYSDSHQSIAIGFRSLASGTFLGGSIKPSVAVGAGAHAEGNNTVAIGTVAENRASYGVALGNESKVTSGSDYGIAIGYQTQVSAVHSMAIGEKANASATLAVALGANAKATGAYSYTAGFNSESGGEAAIAVGKSASASGESAVAVGNGTVATGSDAVAIGTSSQANGGDSIALGKNANASNGDSIAIGQDTVSNNLNSVALGKTSKATGASATALGPQAQATGSTAVAIGLNSEANTSATVAIGQSSAASGLQAIAVGYKSAASGDNAAAYGNTAKAVGKNSLALGANTQAPIEGGVALGAGSIANTVAGAGYNPNTGRSNTYTPTLSNAMTSTWAAVSIGDGTNTRQLTGLAAGSKDTDAVNVAQLKSMNLAFTADGSTKGDVNLTNSALNVVGDSTYITTKGNNQTLTISGKKQNITVTNGTASASAGMADANNVAQAINQANADQTISYKANGGTANTVKVSDGLNFTNGTTTVATIGANGQVTYDLNTTTKQSITDSSTAVNRTIALGGSTGSTTAKKLASGDVKFNIKGETGTNALISTSAAGDDVTIAPTSKLTAAVAAAENAANKNLSNISSSGETVIKNLAKGAAQDAVKVAGTGLATVSDNTTGGVKTYTVDVNTGNLVVTANGQVGAAGTTGASGATGSNGVATTQNVATAINDAVTKANANNAQALADAKHNFAGDDATVISRKHGEQLNIKGGASTTATDLTSGNIAVVGDTTTGTLNIKMAKALTGLTSATFTTAGGNTTVINSDGVTITPSGSGASAISMTTAGINAGNKEIKGVATGTTADAAVNKAQMDAAITAAAGGSLSTEKVVAKTLSGDTNLATVTGQTGTAKGETYEVAVSENAVKNVAKAAAQDAVTVTGTGLATVSDNTAGGVKTYTVDVNTGNLVVTANGQVGAAGTTGASGATGSNGVATTQNVATAINDAVTKANANNAQALADAKHNFAGDDATVISRKHGEQLNIKGGASTTATDLTSGNIAVVGDTTTGTLNIKMAKALTGLTSATFTDGSGNTQIVTGGSSTISDAAGNSTVVSKGGVTTTDAAGNITTTAPTGVTVTPAGTGTTPISVTTSGISAGNKEIKNIANGTTDDAAVNKKQMDDAVKAASDATKALSDNTVSLGSESGTTTAKKLSTTGGITFNIKGETGANALITTSATGDDVTIAPTAKLTDAVTAAEKSADKDLSNLSATGDTYIKNLAKTAASWNVETNGGGTTAVAGGESVNFINGDNIAITNTGRAITIGTAKNVSFDKVTVGGIVLDKTNGINAGGKEVKGIADGTAADSAVSKGQMETAIANAQTAATSTEKVVAKTLSGDTNLATVIGQTGTAKGETYEVAVSENAVKNVAKAAAQDAITVTGTGLATVSDNTAGGVKTYTVNVDEGKLVLDDTTGKIGANGSTQGSTAGKNGVATTQNVATAINDAVTKANANNAQALADAKHNFAGDDATVISRKHGEQLNIKGGASTTATDLTSGNIAVVGDTASGTLNIKMAKALTGLTSATFTDGSGNTQTVTGASSTITDGAGHTTAMTKDGLSTTDGTNTTTVAPAGVTATDGTNTVKLNGSGIDAGNTQIKNVGKATTDDAAVNKKQMDDAVKAASDATKALGDNTVSLGSESGSTTAKKLSTTGGITFNIKGDTGTNALITTSATGDNVTIAPTAKLTAAVAAAEKSADKDLSNISSAGKTVIKDLAVTSARDAVNVTGTGLATVSDNTAGGVKTYTVNVDEGKLVLDDTTGKIGANGSTQGSTAGKNGVATTQNVATAINDAVAKAKASTTQALADAEHKFDGDTGTTSVRKHGEVLSIKGGVSNAADLATGNIGVVSDGAGTLNIRLAKVLSGLTSATFTTAGGNTTVINGDGVTITPSGTGASAISMTTDGINAGGKEVKGIADGTAADSAVSKGQMETAIANAQTAATSTEKVVAKTLSGDNNLATVTGQTGTAKGETYEVAVSENAVKNVAKAAAQDAVTVTGTGLATVSDNTAGGVKTYTVNVDEGKLVLDDTTGKIGANGSTQGSTAGKNGVATTQNVATAINDAVTKANANNAQALADAKHNFAGDDATVISRKHGEQLNIKGGASTTATDLTSGNIAVVGDTASGTLNIKMAKALTGLTSATFTDGSGNTQTVTGASSTITDGAGHTTAMTKDGLSTTDGTNTTTVAPAGVTATDGTNTVKLNGSGIDAGNTQIKNVGKATTDDAAVNKKQMDDAVKSATDATTALGNNTIALGSDAGSTTAKKLSTNAITFNIKGDTGANALITTSATGDDVTIAPTAKLTAAVTAAEKSADKDLSNISSAGKTVIKDLAVTSAQDAVNVTGTGLATVSSNTAGGVKTYTVDVKAGNLVVDANGQVGANGATGTGGAVGTDGVATTQNVATAINDAVTKAKASTTQALADAEHKFDGDTGTTSVRKHGEVLSIKGGVTTPADLSTGNIGVVSDGAGTLNIRLAKVLSGLTSATFKDASGNTTMVTGGSTTIADTSGNTQTLAPTKSEIKDTNGVSTVTTKDGVTAKDASGQTTSLTKGGVNATDGNGNTTSLTNTGVSATDGNGHTTGLTNGGLSTTDGTNTTIVAPTGITATDGTNTVKLNGSGIDAGNTQIKNVGKATTDDAAVNKKQMDDAVKSATDATTALGNNTIALGSDAGSTTAKKLSTNAITFNIKGDTGANALITTSATGDDVTIAPTAKLTAAVTAAEKSADKDLSNISSAGKTVIKDLAVTSAQDAVNVTGTGLATVSDNTTGGVKTYTVDVKAGNLVVDANGQAGAAGATGTGGAVGTDGVATTQNVATAINDAITKSNANTAQALADAEHKFDGDTGTTSVRKHGEVLSIKGGVTTPADLTTGNIGVVSDGAGTLNIRLAKVLSGLTSATFKDASGNTTMVTGGSTTIADTAGNTQTLAPTKSEIKDTNGVSTVTTKDGVTAKDASGQTTSLTKGGVNATDGNGNTTSLTNTGVSATDGNGHTTGLTNGGLSTTDGTNTTTIAPTGMTATDGTNTVKVEGSGIDAGGTEIKHIVAGTAADSAVNKGQMDDAITKATTNATHEFGGDDATVVSRKHGEKLTIKGGASTNAADLTSGNIAVIGDTNGTLNLKLAKVLTGLTSATFTDGNGNTQTVTGTSSTISDGAGNTTTMTKGGLSTTDGTNTTTVAPTGITATDGTNTVKVEGSGIDAGGTEIKHIAAGTAADSAVNKGQMDAAVQNALDGTKALGNNIITLGGDTGSTDAQKLNTSGGIKFNINGESGPNALIKTTASGNSVSIAATTKLTNAVAAAENAANKDLSNLSANGESRIKDLAKSAASWNVQTNDGPTIAVSGGDTVNFTDGKNIKITNTGREIKVATTDDVSFNKVTVGGVTIDNNGIDAGNKEIKNVATGTTANSAVNKQQLDNAIAGVSNINYTTSSITDRAGSTPVHSVALSTGFDFKGDGNIQITQDTANNGVIHYAMNPNLSGITSITGAGTGAPRMTFNSQNGNTPANVSINSNLDMGGHRITGVGPAEKPTDAVNKQQVDQALRGLAGLADNAARQYASKAGANAAALAALKPIQYDPLEPTQIMAGVGNYKSQTAVALGMAHYTNENTMFNIGVSLDSHDNMVNAGVIHKFGYSSEKKAIPDRYKGGPISSIYVMQDEMQALLAKDQEKDAVISKQASEIDTLRQQNEDMQRKIDMILAKLQ